MMKQLFQWASHSPSLQKSMLFSPSSIDSPFVTASRKGHLDVLRWIWNAARPFHKLQERLIEDDDFAAFTNTWDRAAKRQLWEWATDEQRKQMVDEDLHFRIM